MRFWFVLVLVAAQAQAQRWRMQYFYDEDESSLTLTDLSFSSAQRGIAVGYISDGKKRRPTSVVTSDGGAHWSLAPTQEFGLSLFFLNDSLGWMVTDKGIWRTEEAGKSWKRINAPRGIYRVYFKDPQHGWAVGARKAAYETRDGGNQWKKLAAADKPDTNPEHTVYSWIDFAGPSSGLIVGWSRPPRGRQRLPEWLDPEDAQSRREWPTLSIVLQSADGGETWKPVVTSMFGHITRVRRNADGTGLALVEFQEQFEYPSELFRLDPKAKDSERVFRRKDRAVTDFVMAAGGAVYLAAFERPGTLQNTPIPGKLVVLHTSNLKDFNEMEVDYRASGTRAWLAAADASNMWVATDTGMILKMVP